MRKWYSTIDNKTNMEIIYSDCSLNEVGYQLETVDRIQVYNCIKNNNNNGMYEITTKTRTFYYDENRKMLLGE